MNTQNLKTTTPIWINNILLNGPFVEKDYNNILQLKGAVSINVDRIRINKKLKSTDKLSTSTKTMEYH